ncbi:hypothetical protein M407DRAFT_3780 [Tulasnella calospora MUT 4182]|uniref:Retrotransposon gag domain-containing protein n=1 Tax=Tulasnella calospora MUT 4182 TaxID=1051891 RepID=A0A0C3LI95_9AGAM|nr:hypothetical protein M407DRAFT_3780 [Tulasnella calospora MUT 4182]
MPTTPATEAICNVPETVEAGAPAVRGLGPRMVELFAVKLCYPAQLQSPPKPRRISGIIAMSKPPSSTNQELVFYGMDGVEAEEFIRSVLKAAKVAGRLRDDSWILDEVYVAFAGDALRWYIELDVETRNDWLLLQRAIMQKYPPPSQRSWCGSGPSTSK